MHVANYFHALVYIISAKKKPPSLQFLFHVPGRNKIHDRHACVAMSYATHSHTNSQPDKLGCTSCPSAVASSNAARLGSLERVPLCLSSLDAPGTALAPMMATFGPIRWLRTLGCGSPQHLASSLVSPRICRK